MKLAHRRMLSQEKVTKRSQYTVETDSWFGPMRPVVSRCSVSILSSIVQSLRTAQTADRSKRTVS